MAMLVGLMKLELPGRDPLSLCDGGFVMYDGDSYTASDPAFGTLGQIEAFGEGVGDEIPGFRLTLLPVDDPWEISDPDDQGARCRWWIAEVDRDTGLVVGTPEQMADMMVDRMTPRYGAGSQELEIEFVPAAERLFSANDGNRLNPTQHQAIWTGELGENNATGLSVPVAWGTEKPR